MVTKHFPAVIISIAGCVVAACLLGNSIRIADLRQQRAYEGDTVAAARIILPCYRPLFIGLIAFFSFFALALSLTFSDRDLSNIAHEKVVQYFGFNLLTVYAILPVLLVQSSVSQRTFFATFYTLFPWWCMSNLLWFLSFYEVLQKNGIGFELAFVLWTSIPPLLLSAGTLSKCITSRVQTKSVSNRNSIEVLLAYAIIYLVCYLVAAADRSPYAHYIITLVLTIASFIINSLFPFALYRTLLADTKFWRGLGKHNMSGIKLHGGLSSDEVSRPTMELGVASTTFQTMMQDMSDVSVDFAFLQLVKYIGDGATAQVFSGKYKKKVCAVKISNPPEITEEALDVFMHEARIAAAISHVNVVQFYGICVRPPQIAMVFEFCEGGSLKEHRSRRAAEWTTQQRIQGCIDASKGLHCLHSQGYIHRDLKPDNFFVGKRNTVKLGDFGESTAVRTKESTNDRKMTILGTVAFMAPELIAGSRYYDQSIDIYALAITFWELWTGKDVFSSWSTFDIYAKVASGVRPEVPPGMPEEVSSMMQRAWESDPAERPSAVELAIALETYLQNLRHTGGNFIRSESSTRLTLLGAQQLGSTGSAAGAGGVFSSGAGGGGSSPLNKARSRASMAVSRMSFAGRQSLAFITGAGPAASPNTGAGASAGTGTGTCAGGDVVSNPHSRSSSMRDGEFGDISMHSTNSNSNSRHGSTRGVMPSPLPPLPLPHASTSAAAPCSVSAAAVSAVTVLDIAAVGEKLASMQSIQHQPRRQQQQEQEQPKGQKQSSDMRESLTTRLFEHAEPAVVTAAAATAEAAYPPLMENGSSVMNPILGGVSSSSDGSSISSSSAQILVIDGRKSSDRISGGSRSGLRTDSPVTTPEHTSEGDARKSEVDE